MWFWTDIRLIESPGWRALHKLYFFYLHLQQRLYLLFKFRKRKVDSVDQQSLWLAANCYHSDWRLYYTTLFRRPFPFFLLRLVKHLNLALDLLWWLMKLFRRVHSGSRLTTVHCFYFFYLCCFYLTTVFVFTGADNISL